MGKLETAHQSKPPRGSVLEHFEDLGLTIKRDVLGPSPSVSALFFFFFFLFFVPFFFSSVFFHPFFFFFVFGTPQDISNYFYALGAASASKELRKRRVGGSGRVHIFHLPPGLRAKVGWLASRAKFGFYFERCSRGRLGANSLLSL